MTGGKGYQAKKRNSHDRRMRSIILIAAEGKNKTETQYFKDFARAHNQNIKFAPGNETDPFHMACALKKAFRELNLDTELGDHAYCVVDADIDTRKNEQLLKADAICKKAGLQMIVSSPCFEVWCLCHFEYTSKHFQSNDEVTDALCKKLPRYRKSAEGLYETLFPNTEEAIKNARLMEKACADAGYTPHTVEFSPSTEVYYVVETILKNKQDAAEE